MTGALFSPDRVYRYALARWTENELIPDGHVGRHVLFVCLNPSTADEVVNDPTVRRCLGFAERWGYERLVVCNIFAFRATNPKALYKAGDPIGPENDRHIKIEAKQADLVVCAWGAHGLWHPRGGPVTRQQEVLFLLEQAGAEPHVLGLTKLGAPKHPLYLRGDTQPVLLAEARRAA